MVGIPLHATVLACMFGIHQWNSVLNLPSRIVQENQRQSNPVCDINEISRTVKRITPWLVSRPQFPSTGSMDQREQQERFPFCLHRVCAYHRARVSVCADSWGMANPLTLRTASIIIFMLHCLAASQALKSSSFVPHLVVMQPFWSNSPRSHYTNLSVWRIVWTNKTAYQIISIISLTHL